MNVEPLNVYDEAEIAKKPRVELLHWYCGKGWIRRKHKTPAGKAR